MLEGGPKIETIVTAIPGADLWRARADFSPRLALVKSTSGSVISLASVPESFINGDPARLISGSIRLAVRGGRWIGI